MASFQLLSSTNGDFVVARAASLAAVASVPVETDTIVPTGVAGVITTLLFPIRPNTPVDTGRLQCVGSFAYEITVGGGAASTGRCNLVLLKNGVVLAGVTPQLGATQSFAGAGGPFREVLRVTVPSLRLDANDLLQIGVQIEIVNAVAGNATVQLHHDPAVAADSFVADLQQIGVATVGRNGLMSDNGAEGEALFDTSAQIFTDPVETDRIIPSDGAPGVAGIIDFICRPNRPFRGERVEVLGLLNWETTIAGGAAATGRLNLTAKLNGVAITGVVDANGTTRDFAAVAGPFVEVLHFVIPALRMDLDDILQIRVEVELVVAGAAGNCTVQLHHDPDTAGEELPLEFIPLA